MDTILKAVGLIVLGGGGLAAIVYSFFRFLGAKWLETKFSERLEAYKHKQQKELEELRFRINSLFDRTTKLHQREFDVLPEAWGQLNDAYWFTRSFTSPLQTYPDLRRMTAAHLEDFLKDCPLTGWQKDELRASEDKTQYYQDAIFWHRLAECRKAARDCHVYLLKSGIFLPADLRRKFKDIEDLIWAAIQEHEMIKTYPEMRKLRDTKEEKLRVDGEKMLEALEADVSGRLWNSTLEHPDPVAGQPAAGEKKP